MASNYRTATVGVSEPLRYGAESEITGLFPQATIFDSAGAVETTVDLTESGVQDGYYIGSVTISTEGDYDILYIAYTDSDHTTESELAPRGSEVMQVRITSDDYGPAARDSAFGGVLESDIDRIVEELKKALKRDVVDLSGIEQKIDKIPEKIKIPTTDLSSIQKAINNIKIPDPALKLNQISGELLQMKKAISIKQVEGRLDNVEKMIQSIPVKDSDKFDNILDQVDSLEKMLDSLKGKIDEKDIKQQAELSVLKDKVDAVPDNLIVPLIEPPQIQRILQEVKTLESMLEQLHLQEGKRNNFLMKAFNKLI